MKKFNYILIFLFLSILGIKAQTEDFELWTGIGLKKELTKDFDIIVNQGLRFNQNTTFFKKSVSEVGIRYKVNKWIRLDAYYRYSAKRNYEENTEGEHRGQIAIDLGKEIGRFNIKLKNKYQYGLSTFKTSEMPNSRSYLRNRLAVSYNIRKTTLEPKIFAESFIPVTNQGFQTISKYRIGAGMGYTVLKQHQLGLNYFLYREAYVPNPDWRYVLGINYRYDF